ncbi:unnamed protein product [Rhizophagus irregularis]|nr:unnamed protein product [Rhizophagus irregularis]
MVFEDLFYPDNSKRRKTVINYQTKFCQSFKDFKGSWNELCTSFNNAVQNAKKDCVLRLLEYDQDSHNALNEIKEVLEDTKSKVPRIEHDIIGIKDLEGAFKKMNLETIRELKIVLDITVGLLTGTVLISVFITYLASMIDVIRAVIGGVVGGLFASIFLGAVALVIKDAIVGAIERNVLEDAIEACNKFDASCIIHLDDARRKIDGINRNIKDEIYKTDDNHIIINGKLIEINS